jgi:hypothetical protein
MRVPRFVDRVTSQLVREALCRNERNHNGFQAEFEGATFVRDGLNLSCRPWGRVEGTGRKWARNRTHSWPGLGYLCPDNLGKHRRIVIMRNTLRDIRFWLQLVIALAFIFVQGCDCVKVAT